MVKGNLELRGLEVKMCFKKILRSHAWSLENELGLLKSEVQIRPGGNILIKNFPCHWKSLLDTLDSQEQRKQEPGWGGGVKEKVELQQCGCPILSLEEIGA